MILAKSVISGLVQKTTPKTVTKTLTSNQQKAIDWAMQQKHSIAVISTPSNQAKLSWIRGLAISSGLKQKGLTVVPAADVKELYTEKEKATLFRDQINVLTAQQGEMLARETEYQSRISGFATELALGTNKAAILQGQLSDTQTQYQDILNKYNQLLANPEENTKGTDWGNIAILGIIAVGGIILLSSFIGRK